MTGASPVYGDGATSKGEFADTFDGGVRPGDEVTGSGPGSFDAKHLWNLCVFRSLMNEDNMFFRYLRPRVREIMIRRNERIRDRSQNTGASTFQHDAGRFSTSGHGLMTFIGMCGPLQIFGT